MPIAEARFDVFKCLAGLSMATGLVGGEGFAVDASVIEADASRYHGVAPDDIELRLVENPSWVIETTVGFEINRSAATNPSSALRLLASPGT